MGASARTPPVGHSTGISGSCGIPGKFLGTNSGSSPRPQNFVPAPAVTTPRHCALLSAKPQDILSTRQRNVDWPSQAFGV